MNPNNWLNPGRCAVWMASFPFALACAAAPDPAAFSITQTQSDIAIADISGRPQLLYHLKPRPEHKLSVPSAGYFHPFTTPKGVVMTDAGPSDHPHHRGIFLGWVEMHGAQDADFWGWGAHAPTNGRVIVNYSVADVAVRSGNAGFLARNRWRADSGTLLDENLQCSLAREGSANVLHLEYTLIPTADIQLPRWAFSGFCVRTRKDGTVQAYGPSGVITNANPSHLKPETDWPAAPWYGYTLTFTNGTVAGIAVINHPQNPPALWHNHRDVRMLNPCIVAPTHLVLKAKQPFVLRYQVVAHDGPTPVALLDRLARD